MKGGRMSVEIKENDKNGKQKERGINGKAIRRWEDEKERESKKEKDF